MTNFLRDVENYQQGNADNSEVNCPEADQGQASRQTLRECVASSLSEYFDKVDQDNISDLYELVLSEVEAPLLETVMRRVRSNQSKASAMLGLNRGTLRKKLKKYGMLN